MRALAATDANAPDMRILTYNIRAGRDLDYAPALERQAAAIRALAPDADQTLENPQAPRP